MNVAAAALTTLLQLRGIENFYGKIQALRGVDIDVNKGEIVTLIGANGAGKSTTMMTIFGAPRARHGRITFDGHDITNFPTHIIAPRSSPQPADAHDRAAVDPPIAGRTTHLPAHDGVREPADGRLDQQFRPFRRRYSTHVRAFSPPEGARATARGNAIGRRAADAGHRARAHEPASIAASRRAFAWTCAAGGQTDLRGDRRTEQERGPDRLPGRAERLSCAETCPSRLRNGQRRDHDAG